MAINPTAPGVYIQEISTLPPSVAPVATAIPAFIGYTEKAIINGVAWDFSNGPAPAVRISSMVQFESIFGGAFAESYTATLTGTSPNYNVAIAPTTAVSNYILYYHMQMYFGNGGGPCYVIAADEYDTVSSAIDADLLVNDAIPVAEQVDEVTILVVPEAMQTLTGTSTREDIFNAMLDQCQRLQDRFAILDVETGTDPVADAAAFRSLTFVASTQKYGAAYYPSLQTSIGRNIPDANVTISGGPGGTLASLKTSDTALYAKVNDALNANAAAMVLYPCSAMAGIYGATDRTRGVWKAPANVGLRFVKSPTVIITEDDNGTLNIDPTAGKSINAIRQFMGKGNLVWGARTLAGNDNEWRYVNVRRFFNYAEESIKKATEAVVFEPNDANTWLRVKGTITNFLTNEWRNGALVGAKPEHAFFVKVGLNETMTAQDILEGKLIIQIGLAVSRPAEFIILQFMHKLQEA